MNPKDPRYAHLIGKHVVRPLPVELPREQKLIPIIGDEHVDFEFGTGVLKVTPAHDKADFEIGARHKLPAIEVIEADGKMSEAAGVDLRGLDRFKARKVAVEKLTELGALEKEEPYTNNVGYSERADVPIEPRLSEQWFLKYPSVEKARECVEQAGSTGYQPVPPASSPGGMSGCSNSIRRCSCNDAVRHSGGQVAPEQASGLFHPEKCSFIRSAGRKFTTTGWAACRIGASAASFGGDIGFRCGKLNLRSPNSETSLLSFNSHALRGCECVRPNYAGQYAPFQFQRLEESLI